MVATKLLIQSFLGVGALASVVGGSYMLMGSSEEYFLVTSVAEVVNENKADEDLWIEHTPIASSNQTTSISNLTTDTKPTVPVVAKKVENTKTQKNYKCQVLATPKAEDDSCELYSITFSTANKTVYLDGLKEDIKKSKKVIEKVALTDKKFFLLKTKASNDWKFDGTETIKLLSINLDATKKHKAYADLTVHGKITNSQFIGKTSMAIGTANITDSISIAADSIYKCKFKTVIDANLSPCTITELSAPTSNQKLENLNFSSINIPSAQKAITITKDKYYAIKWTDKKWDTSSLKNSVIVVFETTASDSATKQEIEINLKSALFGEFTTNKEEVIIIK